MIEKLVQLSVHVLGGVAMVWLTPKNPPPDPMIGTRVVTGIIQERAPVASSVIMDKGPVASRTRYNLAKQAKQDLGATDAVYNVGSYQVNSNMEAVLNARKPGHCKIVMKTLGYLGLDEDMVTAASILVDLREESSKKE